MTTAKITPEDVAAAFGGTIAFGNGAAAKVAAELGKIQGRGENADARGLGALGHMHPDDAGRAVSAAVERATRGDGAEGARVSIDTSIAAVSYLAARAALAGHQVGGGSDEQPEARTAVSGTASQAGPTSTGAGAAAGSTGSKPTAKKKSSGRKK